MPDAALPTGTVTFLLTDIEGSTRLLDDLGAERYAEALAEHRRLLREAFASHGGVEVDTQGDAFFVAFPAAAGALEAAAHAQDALAGIGDLPSVERTIRDEVSGRLVDDLDPAVLEEGCEPGRALEPSEALDTAVQFLREVSP